MTPPLPDELTRLKRRLEEIAALCRLHNHPGCEPGTHSLANKILAIAEGDGGREFT